MHSYILLDVLIDTLYKQHEVLQFMHHFYLSKRSKKTKVKRKD